MAKFSDSSEKNLQGVYPPLADIARDFTENFMDLHVAGGGRTLDEQAEDVKKGLSETMHSMHLVQADGFFHAIDIQSTPSHWDDSPPALVNGRPITQYEVQQIAMLFAFKAYAQAKGVKVRIGADWNGNNYWPDNKFNDLDHVEVPVVGSN